MYFCLRLAALMAVWIYAPVATAEPFKFMVVGDQPYGDPKEVYPRYEALIDKVNARNPDLVIHVGDTKSGITPCTDQMQAEQLEFLNSFTAPTLYTPGDNEWTDCHRWPAGHYDPQERLSKLRDTYFAAPDTSLGKNPIRVSHQASRGYPENARVVLNDVMFVTAHVVGSNNNFGPDSYGPPEEHAARDQANRTWLNESFAAAQDSKALVLAIHADIFRSNFGSNWDKEAFRKKSGYKKFGEALIDHANAYGKPVLLVFGDGHRFGMLRPLRKRAPTIMAVETFGGHHMHAVEIGIDTTLAFPFSVQPITNPLQPIKPVNLP